ncbi:transglycosylase domain-containing protein [Erythrobacter sp. BLCC-B19]|uniref:transglycosylase domain-containing protein n=1 Tax=Erythrobacter sp. BLCC-B19 TaxID=3025315 RepID=UPI00235EB780|nr:transglycosylase domain-containing protein [Erythrobacter sp. BLCC-B19]WDA40115.1 transglycosylase domain-containing protein [Erythrobacter sp. BLCC-B19]
MAFFDRFWKGTRTGAPDGAGTPAGFYPLYESSRPLDDDEDDDVLPRPKVSATPDYDAWDAKLGQIDEALVVTERKRLRPWQRDYWRTRSKWWWAGRAAMASLAVFALLIGWLMITAPLSKSLEPIAPPQVTLLASDGTPIARQGAVVEAPVKVADLPPHVVEAFLAIEDRRFYSHWGIDPRGIARAAWTGYGGGSTITQQLAKFTFLTPEQSITRKAREALIAVWLESWLTKDEILERYLSNAYFGDNQYGLRAASLHYFYRQPEKLRPEQAAMLAGLLQAPSRYAPTKHYDKAKARMELVIKSMVDVGYLTKAEADALPDPRIDVRTRDDNLPTGTYFADWALPLAREGMEASYSQATLTTTLDSRLQSLANRIVARSRIGNAQVALVAMRRNGEVVAMVGGRDYAKSPFNRVTQAKRQPGSTFKTFVYLTALQEGWEPDDTIPNTPITQGSYRPKNAREQYSPQITLEDAFASSSNVAAVRLLQAVGSDKVIRTARRLGITSPMTEGDPSLALGTSSMTLMELTAAYAGIAANQYPVEPHAFPRGEQGWLEWLTTRTDSMSDRTHEDLEGMLRAAINRGTGRAAVLPIANFGKTGTTQDYRDALFVGYAGDLVVGVWVGNDDNTPLNGITGGSLPARIWADFMRSALKIEAAPAPEPSDTPDPEGPVMPMDVIEGEIPLGQDGTSLQVDGNGVTLRQDGVPVEVRVDQGGVVVRPSPAPTPPP